MSGRWFDSSRQIFWDNNQQDLSIPGTLYSSNATIANLQADRIELANTIQFIAVGLGNDPRSTIQFSYDGSNWNPIASGGFVGGFGPPTGFGVAYNGSQYVAVGIGDSLSNTIQVSSDGFNWSNIVSGGFSAYGLNVAYGNGLWIAVGGGPGEDSINTIQTSKDGFNWSPVSSNGFNKSAGQGIAYNSTTMLWVATGLTYGDPTSTIQTSIDGSNWNSILQGGFNQGNGFGLDTSGPLWVATGADTDPLNSIQWSSNGSNWFSSLTGGFTYSGYQDSSGYDVAYSAEQNLWVAVGESLDPTCTIQWSSNGSNWNPANSGGFDNDGYPGGITYNTILNTWVATGYSSNSGGTTILYSTDGSNWSASVSGGFASDYGLGGSGVVATNLPNSGTIITASSVSTSQIITSNIQVGSATISSIVGGVANFDSLNTSSIVINSVTNSTAQISSLTTVNISSLKGQLGQLITSSIVSNNVSSFTNQVSSLTALNISTVQGQIGALITSSIVSNNLSSFTAQISSLITLNISTVQETVNALTASSIVSNNVSSFTSQVSSLTALNISSLREQTGAFIASSIVSNNVSSFTNQVSSLIALNISTVQESVNGLTTSSIVSNNVSSFTNQVSSLTALNVSSLRAQVGGLTTSSISSINGQISSLTTINLSSLQGQIGQLTTSSLITLNLSSVQVQTSSIRSNNISSLTGQITNMSITNGSFSNLAVANSFFSWQTTTTGDAFNTATVSNFNVGSGNFTMECFFYPTATPTNWGTIMSLATTATNGHEFRITQRNGSAGLGFLFPSTATLDGNVSLLATSTLGLNTWYHLALTRSTNWMYLYSNGTAVLSTNLVNHTYNENKQLFLYNNPYNDTHGQGYINSARVVVGQALYTGNFIPPTQQLSTSRVGAYGFNVVSSLTGTVAFLGGTVSTFTDAGPSALALTVAGSPTSGTSVPTTFTGAIGINCNSPQFALDVNGTGNFTSANFISTTRIGSSSAFFGDNSPNGHNVFAINTGNALNDGMQIASPSSFMQFVPNASGSNNLIRSGSNSGATLVGQDLIFQIGGTETIRFISTGGVTMPNLPANNVLITSAQQQILLSNAGVYTYMQSATNRIRLGAYSNTSGMPFTINESGGNVGINCNAPQYQLDVNGTTSVSGVIQANSTINGQQGATGTLLNTIQIANGGYYTAGMKGVIIPNGFGDGIRLDFFTPLGTNNSTQTTRMTILPFSGNIGINISTPQYTLDVNGTTHQSNNLTTWGVTSDRRIKTNIEFANLDICYSSIQALTLRRYEYDSNVFPNREDKHVIGLIAQEVQPIFPKAVTQTSSFGFSDLLGINYDQLYMGNLGATKKLMEVVEQQGSTIKSIQQQLSTLQKS